MYISALLLVVYFFIAAPTQLWHHHFAVPGSITAAGEHASFLKLPSAAIEPGCEVCSHQYSAYVDYAAVMFSAPVFPEQRIQAIFYLSIPSDSADNLINKGPPAFL